MLNMFSNISCFLFTLIHFYPVVLEHGSFTYFFSEIVNWKKIMCGAHESKQIPAMLVFLKLIECISVESSELPNGTKTGKAFFNDKCRTL